MHTTLLFLLLILLSLPAAGAVADEPGSAPEPVPFEFGGYRFGQSPAANMDCTSGFCKSQAPGGDGRVTFPYSIYTTPGAVSTVSGLSVVNVRYTFWNDRLYRIAFQVDCTPLGQEECLQDIITFLDREYDLTPLSSFETQQFIIDRRIIVKEFVTEAGAFVKVRAATHSAGPQMPLVDIVDKETSNHVGSFISPTFKPQKIDLPEGFRKP